MIFFIKNLKHLFSEGKGSLFYGISRFLLDPFCLFFSFEVYLPVNTRVRFYVEKSFFSYFFVREDRNIATKTVIRRDRKEYLEFVSKLKDITKNWKNNYQPSVSIKDGFLQLIVCRKIDLSTELRCAHPENFSEYEDLIDEYFPWKPLQY